MQIKPSSKIIIFFIIIIILGLVGGYQLFVFTNRTNLEKLVGGKRNIGILLVGRGAKKIEFCSIAYIAGNTKRIGLISTFPETRFDAKSPTIASQLEDNLGDVKERFEDILGIDIPFYIQFSTKEVAHILDILEGLEYFMLKNQIHKRENLPSGRFTLDGSMVKRYLEASNAEAGLIQVTRLYRYYSLGLNLWKEKKLKWKILRNPIIFKEATQDIKSNISASELFSLANLLFADDDWLPMFMELSLKRQADKYILNTDSGVRQWRRFKKTLLKKGNPYLKILPVMNVQNGTQNKFGGRVNGLAKKVANRLRFRGINMSGGATNAEEEGFHESILLDLSANSYYLYGVGKLIKVKNYFHAIDRNILIDLVLILGNDYKNLKTSNE